MYYVHLGGAITTTCLEQIDLCLQICSSLLLTILGNINLTGPAIILILSYQLFLTKLGLSEYLVLGADGQGGRVGFFDSNREGIVSCLGYLSLYFLAVELGKHIFNKERYIFMY